jgi:CBS-domain-containing membrane protein
VSAPSGADPRRPRGRSLLSVLLERLAGARLPVVDADGALLGLLRDADVFRAWLAEADGRSAG